MESEAKIRSANSRSHNESRSKPEIESWHTLPLAEVFKRLDANETQGLAQADAFRRLAQQGPNTLARAQQRTTLSILLAQFHSLIVVLLLAATAIAFAMGENIEAVAILVVIVINAGIGFATEWKAEEALSALQKQTVRVAHVIRDGAERQIPAAELVPGDLVVLAAGARVPADGRIVESVRLQIEEAALTGESHAVTKSTALLTDKDSALGDRFNMAFLGTAITDGRGRLVVTATGSQTEVGKIGVLIDAAITRDTPLEQKLSRLGQLLIVVVLALCAVVVLAGWLRGVTDFWHMLEIGLSLAIAAVPEGLPAVTTMTLALGMQRMARMRAIVRRLPAVETLGSVTVICTDKTGTLTKNEMTVCVYALDQRRVDVTGAGYQPIGDFRVADKPVDQRSDEHLALALRIGMLCNDAKVERTDGRVTVLGDPTEAALVVVGEKAGMNQVDLAAEFPRSSELPFDSTSKHMVTVHRAPQGRIFAFVKGAPATLLAASSTQFGATGVTSLTPDDSRRWHETNQELASAALRVLGLAYRELPEGYDEGDLGRDLIFVGLVGMSDPLRDEAKAAIATCRTAGIRTVMITGDQQPTAAEIARQLGIDCDLDGRPLGAVHGRELTGLDLAGWQRVVADAAVFARVSPEHKLQIVEALQEQGHVVAMTGDGVNDAPALKKADIGIAMGIKGTEVAKENADMVITDDNFASIVGAVEQGRIIYGNILRFLHYLLSCNFSEILTVFLALMIGWPLPLVALQILWLNLITDIFPAFALALEPSAPDVMKRPPRDQKESLLTPRFVGLIVWQGLLLAGVTLLAFRVGMHWYGTDGGGLRQATTMAFMTLALAQVVHALNARSQRRSAFTSRLFTNGWLWAAVGICLVLQAAAVYLPLLRRVLHTSVPSASDWWVIAACSLLPVAVIELVKLVQRIAVRNLGISHV
ncbi:cation-translocating P-type ATPase [Lacipirellula parvula]|uniref:Cation-transporting ATPase n=1 Tax=Lacipirellula parvula TaxID=2650471 RepID=A0A5K7X9J7_9BACT|nr:HAD-IC family P-type ATPase [Lacipirellula parvula]BBO33414.1 cation-transporting ATPase [Lacipirellula parvula]